MSIRKYAIRFKIIQWIVRALISLDGEDGKIELFKGAHYRVSLVKEPIEENDDIGLN